MTPANESRPPENSETPSYSPIRGWAFVAWTVSGTKSSAHRSPLRKDRALTSSLLAASHSGTLLTGICRFSSLVQESAALDRLTTLSVQYTAPPRRRRSPAAGEGVSPVRNAGL